MKLLLTLRMSVTAAGIGAVLLSAATIANAGGLNPIRDKTTLEECSACHLAYPAGLLPKAAWKKILNTLGDHFGEDASLDAATTKHIRDYLAKNANSRLSTTASNPVLRITEYGWFNRQHGTRARNYAKNHASIGTISNCTGCHRGAERGQFDDD